MELLFEHKKTAEKKTTKLQWRINIGISLSNCVCMSNAKYLRSSPWFTDNLPAKHHIPREVTTSPEASNSLVFYKKTLQNHHLVHNFSDPVGNIWSLHNLVANIHNNIKTILLRCNTLPFPKTKANNSKRKQYCSLCLPMLIFQGQQQHLCNFCGFSKVITFSPRHLCLQDLVIAFGRE